MLKMPPSHLLASGSAATLTAALKKKKNLGQGLVTSTLKTVANHEIETAEGSLLCGSFLRFPPFLYSAARVFFLPWEVSSLRLRTSGQM